MEHNVWYVYKIPQSMWIVYYAKMPVFRNPKRLKNVVASSVLAGWRVNGRCACKHIAKVGIWPFKIGMYSAYIQTAQKAIHAIQPNGQLLAKNAIMNDANRTGA